MTKGKRCKKQTVGSCKKSTQERDEKTGQWKAECEWKTEGQMSQLCVEKKGN